MTIQLNFPTSAGKNKKALQDALNEKPSKVVFMEPTPWAQTLFTEPNAPDRFAVVMDPETRRRFATVTRTPKGWRVT